MNWMSKMFRGLKEWNNPATTSRDPDRCNKETKSIVVSGDNPIQRIEDDTLGRGAIATSFAQQILAVDAREGAVVGVLGPWGSGKTSFINLARAQFKEADVPVLDFNPWMFSGAQQLVESFFIELSAQLRIRPGFVDIGESLQDYGEVFSGMAWLPVVGPWIERGRGLAKVISQALRRRKEGISGRQAKLKEALADLRKPIVVVLDDIDRLSTPEIRDVFKLVRLTASFPNIVYVVAFDRGRVEQALGDQGVPGRDYLEKILQIATDLPAIPEGVLSSQIFSAIDSALATVERAGPFDEQVWPDVFMEIIRPLVRNMRDVRRYAAAIHGTIGALNGQIALPDVLALEAIRIFLPDVFAHLHSAIDALTTIYDFAGLGRDEHPEFKLQIEDLISVSGKHGQVVRDTVVRLFPAAERHIGGTNYGGDWKGRWLKDRRVAHEHVLRLYLERVAGKGLQAFNAAEQAWAHMANRDALNEYLRSLDREHLPDVIASLEIYEDQFASEHVIPGVIVLLNLLPDLPERQLGMLQLNNSMIVSRVTYRLLRSLGNADAVEEALRCILPELRLLSAKLEVVGQVGYREGKGHKLVSETSAANFERAWREEVRTASATALATEVDLLRVLFIANSERDQSEPPVEIPDLPQLTLAMLRSARSEARIQTSGSRAIRRSPRLAWQALVELYGNEETLKHRIESLNGSGPRIGGADDLLELAGRYVAGWRPHEGRDE